MKPYIEKRIEKTIKKYPHLYYHGENETYHTNWCWCSIKEGEGMWIGRLNDVDYYFWKYTEGEVVESP